MGAWIETIFVKRQNGWHCVAPRMGAWIETVKKTLNIGALIMSRPAWARGLKLVQIARLFS